MKPTFLKFFSFGRFDFAIYLRQGFFTAHRQNRMAEGNHDADHANQAKPVGRIAQRFGNRCFAQPAERIFLFMGNRIELRNFVAVFIELVVAVCVDFPFLTDKSGFHVGSRIRGTIVHQRDCGPDRAARPT